MLGISGYALVQRTQQQQKVQHGGGFLLCQSIGDQPLADRIQKSHRVLHANAMPYERTQVRMVGL
ncbi:MAG TPA: hypothetical protein VF772_01095, partial [Terriglobales bacterium]